jgi:hypothetical protein
LIGLTEIMGKFILIEMKNERLEMRKEDGGWESVVDL